MAQKNPSAEQAESLGQEAREPRVYEVGYLLLPHIAETDVELEVDKIKAAISSVSGLEISAGAPRLMELAYPMHKIIDNKRNQFTRAYFGWIKFDVSPHEAAELKRQLEAMPNMLRFLFVSTVREDTYITDRRFIEKNGVKEKDAPKVAPPVTHTPPEKTDEEPEKVDEAEFEQKIDDIVAEE